MPIPGNLFPNMGCSPSSSVPFYLNFKLNVNFYFSFLVIPKTLVTLASFKNVKLINIGLHHSKVFGGSTRGNSKCKLRPIEGFESILIFER